MATKRNRKAEDWAWRSDCGGSQKLVLIALARGCNNDWNCSPSQQALADWCGLTRKTVNEALSKLQDIGLITISDGKFHQKTYQLSCNDSTHVIQQRSSTSNDSLHERRVTLTLKKLDEIKDQSDRQGYNRAMADTARATAHDEPPF